MIDDVIDTELEVLLRAALHEMIPKTEAASRSAAGASRDVDEDQASELSIRPVRAIEMRDAIASVSPTTGARRRRSASVMAVVATAALVVVLISLAVIRDPNATTEPSSAPASSDAAPVLPGLSVFPSGGVDAAVAAGFDDPATVVAAYLDDRTDPSRLPPGYEMAATVGNVAAVDDDTAVVSIHLQTTNDSGDGLVAVQRVPASSGAVWLVTAAAVFTDELLDVQMSGGQLTGRFASTAGGQTYFDAYDASTGVLIDSTAVTLPVLSGDEATRPEAAFELETGSASVVALRYWNIVDPVNAYAFANFAEVPVMADTPGMGAGWVELQRIRTPDVDDSATEATPPALLLPPASADDTVSYAQRAPALGHRFSGAIQAPDGSMMSANVSPNFWGSLPAGTEQQTIGGETVGLSIEDSNLVYVVTAPCSMFTIDDGNMTDAWRPEVVALLEAATIGDGPVDVALPAGWELLGSGPVSEWYSLTYETHLAGNTRTVNLTQMPGSNAGPLLAGFAGFDTSPVAFRDAPAHVAVADDDYVRVVWEHDGNAYMIGAASATIDELAAVADTLVAQSQNEWSDRFGERDNFSSTSVAPAVPPPDGTTCAEPDLTISDGS